MSRTTVKERLKELGTDFWIYLGFFYISIAFTIIFSSWFIVLAFPLWILTIYKGAIRSGNRAMGIPREPLREARKTQQWLEELEEKKEDGNEVDQI